MQCYQDLKKNVRNKATKIKASRSQTGGGPSISNSLPEIDNTILNLDGKAALEGLPIQQNAVIFVS